jgi:hypothetical protein
MKATALSPIFICLGNFPADKFINPRLAEPGFPYYF